ncbi:cytochrome o ubiquinol oxidase operon protein cyoD [Palleronia aestuarii]|uniref:Cytochrome bo(3) ubiquinol oxidase subunit 4 n=1 Tax=Palleronia aestuarii TaxID=568105 RepID=A0A2W7N7M8_9RHOB|nr:cytochrome o ubiquinol oxidase subunit IV [Palleronia aestuarii]PZX15723.1 cytochrome o ubiquinol oxidase operon protein cyoD [Palleronia aestuarii]
MRRIAEKLMLTSKNEEERDERRYYGIGLILSVVLTVASFASVMTGLLPRPWIFPALVVLALSQIVVHLRIFLHIDLSRQKREDLQVLLFTLLLLGIMAFGTLWILRDLAHRMM